MSGLHSTMALVAIVMVSGMVVSRDLRRFVGTVFLISGLALLLFALMTTLAGPCQLDLQAWPTLACGQ